VSRYEAVLLDAFGTLIDVDRPFARLQSALARHLGVDVAQADAERAFRAEMRFYVDHCHEGADAATLADLRARCAAIILGELRLDADPATAAAVLIDAVAFRAFDDVHPLLRGLRAAEVRTAVVSNWDCSLPDALRAAGVGIDAVFDSASSRSAKPDPGIFHRALGALGVPPGRALHVGDTEAADGVGARAAGVDVRIIDRSGGAGGPDTITALTEVLDLL
jgi:putative hydrolase of the HAD superfamily